MHVEFHHVPIENIQAGQYQPRQDFNDATLKELDKIIGLKHLYAFHVNDSMKDLGTRVDRHAPIGEGKIGNEAFAFLMTDAIAALTCW